MLIDLAAMRESGDGERLQHRHTRARRPVGCTAIERVNSPETSTDGLVSIVDSSTGFELTMVGELYQGIKEHGGLSSLRPTFEELRASILADPFGKNNIDRHMRSIDGQQARIPQRIPADHPLFSAIPGVELAIKTTGLDSEKADKRLQLAGIPPRSSAFEQFQTTLEFQRLQANHAPNGLFGGMRPARVYGALKEPKTAENTPQREWLLMEYVNANRDVVTHTVIQNGKETSGFSRLEYPELSLMVAEHEALPAKLCAFEDVVATIAERYPWAAPFLGDISGENMLEALKPRDKNGVIRKEYIFIDVALAEPQASNSTLHLQDNFPGIKI